MIRHICWMLMQWRGCSVEHWRLTEAEVAVVE